MAERERPVSRPAEVPMPNPKRVSRDVAAEITDLTICKLKEGVPPWWRPWRSPRRRPSSRCRMLTD